MGPTSYNLGYSVRLPLLILLALAVCFGAPAETSDYEGQTVVRVEFVPPRQPLTQSHLARVVRVKQGGPLRLSDVRETIHGLFAAGRYSSQIRVEAEPVEGGVAVRFHAEPSWYIGEVRVTGVPAPPTENQLVNIAGLKLGELYTNEKRAIAEQAVRGLLEHNGFFLPRVALATSDNDESQQRDIEIRVQSGPRAVIGDVIVSGPDPRPDASPAVEELRRIAQWRRGKPFHQRHIQKGLDRLEKHFQRRGRWQSEIRVTGRQFDPDNGAVTFVVFLDPGPRVEVTVEGAEFSRAELRRYIPVFEEGVVDDDLLEEGRRNLRDVLQSRGYFKARVEVDRALGREAEVGLVYRIDRGPRHRMARLDIRGYSFFDLETIRERMLVREKTFSLRRGRFNETLLARDRRAIEDLYIANGFRDVKVESRVEDDYRGREGDLAVFIQIEEGVPTFVEEVRIHGADNNPAEQFYPDLASAPGQVFSELNVATDRDLILGTYYDDGFQDARFSWRAEPGSAARLVVIDYEIQEGERLFVRRPIASGFSHTRRSLVDSQIRIAPGEPLSQSRMLETQRRLYDLGIFSKVAVDLQNPEGDEPSKNVLLQLQEARRWNGRRGRRRGVRSHRRQYGRCDVAGGRGVIQPAYHARAHAAQRARHRPHGECSDALFELATTRPVYLRGAANVQLRQMAHDCQRLGGYLAQCTDVYRATLRSRFATAAKSEQAHDVSLPLYVSKDVDRREHFANYAGADSAPSTTGARGVVLWDVHSRPTR